MVIALLVEKSIIKIDEVTMVILQNEVLKRENPTSSSSNGSSSLVILEDQVVANRAIEDHEEDDPGPRRGTPARSGATGEMSWDIVSEIILNSKIG